MDASDGFEIRSSACPKCGCADVDIDASDFEAMKLVCWDCGTTYQMSYENSIPPSEAR